MNRRVNSKFRGRGTDLAMPSPELAAVGFQELRAYRKRLSTEEERISYWRSLVQTRIDTLIAASQVEELTPEMLVKALAETGTGARRRQLLRVTAHDTLPELPELAAQWSAAVDPHDPVALQGALVDLRSTEKTLSEYRRSLHDRIDAAEQELVVRYRNNRSLGLNVHP